MPAHDPYGAPQSPLVAQAGAVVHVDAGRFARLLAFWIDALIGGALLIGPMWLSGYIATIASGQQPDLATRAGWAGIGFAVFCAVQGLPLARWGQTWGKRVLHLRIVGLDGRLLPLARLLALRYLPFRAVALVPVLGPLVVLADVLMIFGAQRRCLHDRLAGTRVVVAD